MKGNRKKNIWTDEEEKALLAGITKYGVGKWKNILVDPELADQFVDRTNIDLKDKWRNIKMNARPIREISEAHTLESPSSVPISPANTSPVVSNESSPNSSADMSNESRYDAMVFEALSTINDENGSDLNEILSFIEERHEVPQNFRELLIYSLPIFVSQDKLKNVQNRYKISVTKAKKPKFTLHPKDSAKPPELPSTSVIITTSKETQEIDAAANKIAERINKLTEENKLWYKEGQDCRNLVSECLKILVSEGKMEKVLDGYTISELVNKVLDVAPEVVAKIFVEADIKRSIAAEAVKEAERMDKLVEESQTMLQLSLEIQKQRNLKSPHG